MNLTQSLKQIVPKPLWPYFGAVRHRAETFSFFTDRQKARLLGDPELSPGDRELLRQVSSRIYFRDGMYGKDGAHYFKVGLDAIRCIDQALTKAGQNQPQRILDLPCGGGRVLRFLARRFPGAELTACELIPGAVKFCARTFNARPVISSPQLEQVSFDQSFDLIWCGSLVTHLDQPAIQALLRLFRRSLSDRGVLVVTAHGEFVRRRLPSGEFDYGLTAEQAGRMVQKYAAEGFAYEAYPGVQGYGVSLTSPEWIRRQINELGGLREVHFEERGWDRHQDVYGFSAQTSPIRD